MKKALLGLIILILISNCAGCGSNNSPATDETQETQELSTTETEFWGSHWTEKSYVDEFNDPTADKYLCGTFSGTFSNSATSNSNLTAMLIIDKYLNYGSDYFGEDIFRIRLLEYGSHNASFSGSEETDVEIKIKIDNVVTQDTAYFLDPSNGEIYINRRNEIFVPFIAAMNDGKEVSFAITVSSYGRVSSTYRFDVDPEGLSDIYHSWLEEV
ncbi:MAG TPA: hypothetical protein IAD22_01280 [Candidatus Limousia pullorum]|uniref:Lipoprotein n=1 Tax=Candidatus Limousia pullorum TaxID=2840860 RepID=A0A9D1LX64_9FIRM|nr:hypothetical protein [Candidatus Limousia pullorum]